MRSGTEWQTASPSRAGACTGRGRSRPGNAVLAADRGGTYDSPPAPSAQPREDGDACDDLVRRLARQLETDALDSMDDGALRSRLAVLKRLQGLVAVATAATVQRLASAGAVADDGASSTTAWISDTTGVSRREASRIARRASSLADLPETASALAAGAIGVETADIVIVTARDGRLGSPTELERHLLPVAECRRPEQLRAEVRRRIQQVDAAAMLRDERRQHQRRRLSMSRREDGMWELYGLLPGEASERVRTLIDAFDHPDPQDSPPERRRSAGQRMADAFVTAIGAALDLGAVPTAGGVSRPHVSVVVDLATLDADLTAPDHDGPVAPDDTRWADLPGGHAAWGTTLSPQAVRQLCCDAGVSRVVTNGPGQVLDVGRRTRVWSGAQRRAVNARDRSCRGPGCDRPLAWTHIHHVRWWRRGGRTDIANGIALCPGCHDLVHRAGWQVELDPGDAAATWTSPDGGRVVVTHPRPPT